jgi:vancomycin resistance protein VanJ
MTESPQRYGAPRPGASLRWHGYNLFVAGLIGYFILSVTVGDRFWPVLALDYVAMLLLPLAFLLLPVALFRKRWGAVLLQTAAAFAFIWMVQSSHAANDSAPPPPGSIPVTTLTYNLGNGMAGPDTLIPMLRASGADIIALQEVTAETAGALNAQLSDLYPYQVSQGLGIEGKALLSRYPIQTYEWLEFNPGRPDLRAEIDLDGVTIVVIVAHPPPPALTWSGIQPRPGTAHQMTSLIDMIRNTDAPLLLLGDLNITQMHDVYGELQDAGLQDTFRVAGNGLGFTIPARIAKLDAVSDMLGDLSVVPAARIDYVWASSAWQPVAAWTGEDAGSDHLPVLATVSLIPPGT